VVQAIRSCAIVYALTLNDFILSYNRCGKRSFAECDEIKLFAFTKHIKYEKFTHTFESTSHFYIIRTKIYLYPNFIHENLNVNIILITILIFNNVYIFLCKVSPEYPCSFYPKFLKHIEHSPYTCMALVFIAKSFYYSNTLPCHWVDRKRVRNRPFPCSLATSVTLADRNGFLLLWLPIHILPSFPFSPSKEYANLSIDRSSKKFHFTVTTFWRIFIDQNSITHFNILILARI